MLTYWETLAAIQSNVPVNDSYAKLWGRKSQGGYTVVTYTGTLPATLTGTKAGYLQRYKIFGNTEQIGTPTPENPIVPQECGERTENLAELVKGHIDYSTGIINYNDPRYLVSNYMKINGNRYYFHNDQNPYTCAYYDENKTYMSGVYNIGESGWKTPPQNAKYIVIGTLTTSSIQNSSALYVDEARDYYIPYGYKLPLTSAGQDADIYLGDDTLSTDEYVDSGTGKIYRMVGGVLTPTDPPIPFPQIPTSAGSTTISWAGEGLAPSKVEFEYEKEG